jgi:hypothetical protein
MHMPPPRAQKRGGTHAGGDCKTPDSTMLERAAIAGPIRLRQRTPA